MYTFICSNKRFNKFYGRVVSDMFGCGVIDTMTSYSEIDVLFHCMKYCFCCIFFFL